VNARQTAERLAVRSTIWPASPSPAHQDRWPRRNARDRGAAQAGQIRALCATSTLELGIDMGGGSGDSNRVAASVASGMQRIGRAGTTWTQ